MIDCIKKAAQTGRKINVIYLSKSGSVSKRTIQVVSYTDKYVVAFCYMRRQLRTFKVENILAIEQSKQKMEAYI